MIEDNVGLQFLLAVLGLIIAAAVPVITKFLADWLKANTNEKTMIVLSELVQVAVEAAEDNMPTGKDKRDFVVASVSMAAKAFGLKISDDALEELVDMLLEAAVLRTFNTPVPQLPEGFG